jgi:hypothetical protein
MYLASGESSNNFLRRSISSMLRRAGSAEGLYPRLALPDILRYHDVDSTFFGGLFLELVGFDVTASELLIGS